MYYGRATSHRHTCACGVCAPPAAARFEKSAKTTPCTVEMGLIDKGFLDRAEATSDAAATLTRRAKHRQNAILPWMGLSSA